jgi:hypothetical protein
VLEDREWLNAAKTPLIAQYAPKTPRTTVKIAVLLTKKAVKSALTGTGPLLAASLESRGRKYFTVSAFDPRRC